MHFCIYVVDKRVAAKGFISLVALLHCSELIFPELLIVFMAVVDPDDFGTKQTPLTFPDLFSSQEPLSDRFDEESGTGDDLGNITCVISYHLQHFHILHLQKFLPGLTANDAIDIEFLGSLELTDSFIGCRTE